MHLKITAPDSLVFSGEVTKVSLPTDSGQIVILPDHHPLATVILPGNVEATLPTGSEHNTQSFAVGRGLAYVDGDNIVVTTAL